MRIAVTASSAKPQGPVDPHLGRAPYLLIYDTDQGAWEVLDNRESQALHGGAGVAAAERLAQQRVDVVLTGSCGPKAAQALGAAGIQVRDGVTGNVAQAVQDYLSSARAAVGENPKSL